MSEQSLAHSGGEYFSTPFDLGGKQVRGRFVIPSGIRCVRGSVIGKCFAEVDQVGVITTKSISTAPRQGYREPIYARYSSGSYINAVGLANPGAMSFREELEHVVIPGNKFLLISIFGRDVDEFAEAARILTPVADGFELNMSCPHAAGYGIELGQDVNLVTAITGAVARVSGLPVYVKLSATIAQAWPYCKGGNRGRGSRDHGNEHDRPVDGGSRGHANSVKPSWWPFGERYSPLGAPGSQGRTRGHRPEARCDRYGRHWNRRACAPVS